MAVRQVHTAEDLHVASPKAPSQTATTTSTTTTDTSTKTSTNTSTSPSNALHAYPLLVFSFVTENCRACSYARAGFERLASEFDNRTPSARSVRFYEVNMSSDHNQRLGQRLGVQAVPSFQLYAFKNANAAAGWQGGFGVLDELVGPRVVAEVRKRLLHYASDSFDLDEYVFVDDV